MMNAFKAGDLSIEVAEREGPPRIELVWRGKSNDRYPSRLLEPFFSTVLEQAGQGGRVLELRFEVLEHFNSSTIGALIELLQTARSKKVPLVMCYDADIKWQKLSFDALRVFMQADGLLDLRSVAQDGGA